jgi:hypothetical protein
MGEKYKLSNIKQYRKIEVSKRDVHKNEYPMDKILVFEQYGSLYFFDMNIDRISNKYIRKY